MEEHNLKQQLKTMLDQLQDWQKAPTSIPGIRIVKIPAIKNTPARLGIEINPVDSAGKPIKKNGAIVLTNMELFQKYMELFSHPKLRELMDEVELIRTEDKKTDIDIIEI